MMKNYIKKLLVFSIVFTLFGCSSQKKDEQIITSEQDISTSSDNQETTQETAPIFTFEDDIVLEGTITEQVYVDSDNDVTITLRNVTADMSQTVINVNSSKSTTIILEGENTFNVSGVEVKAIDSRDDLIIKGSGFLTINSTDTAIKSNDDLTVKSGTLTLNSTEGDGLRANEKLVIDGGTIYINSSEGLEATEIEINDGVIEVNATDDGINASDKSSKGLTPIITINGGELTVNMKQGDTDAIDSNGYIYINGGVTNINAQFAFDFVSGAEFNGGEVYVNGQQISQIDNSMFGNPGGGMMLPQGVGQMHPGNSSGQGFAPNGNFGHIPPENQTEGEKPRRGN